MDGAFLSLDGIDEQLMEEGIVTRGDSDLIKYIFKDSFLPPEDLRDFLSNLPSEDHERIIKNLGVIGYQCIIDNKRDAVAIIIAEVSKDEKIRKALARKIGEWLRPWGANSPRDPILSPQGHRKVVTSLIDAGASADTLITCIRSSSSDETIRRAFNAARERSPQETLTAFKDEIEGAGNALIRIALSNENARLTVRRKVLGSGALSLAT